MSAPASYRAPGPGDLAAMAENVGRGFDSFREFAPARWEPPPARTETERIAERMALPRASAILAEVAGEPAGHGLLIPAGGSRDAVDDPRLAHLMHLFVREPFWGTGIALELHARLMRAAADDGFTGVRLYTPEKQARARRFYEREGWTLERGPWLEEGLGLEAVEYRRPLR